MTGAAASLPKTRVWGFDLPDPSTAPGEPPVLAAFRIWPGAGVTTTTRRGVPDYLRARYYDPSTAQFISRDPAVATTRQPYAYVNDNPLNGTDPSGLMCLEFWDASKCSNPLTQLLGGTTGMGVQASADIGLPWRSIGGTLGADRYLANRDFCNSNPALDTATYGSFNTAHNNNGWALGAQASAGGHFTFSTVPQAEGMLGPFHNFNVNLGWISDGSLTVSWDDYGHWGFSPGLGLGAGASISAYDTDTIRR